METSQYTKTFQESIPFGQDKLYFNLSIPITFNKKIPITLFISDIPSNVNLGAYVYTIGRGKETYNTVLNQAGNDALDLATKISRALWIKYQTPIYFNLNGSYDPFEYLELIREVLNFVELKVNEHSNTSINE